MRYIDTHHDGHGLNESITIRADEADGSGASHFYQLEIQLTKLEECLHWTKARADERAKRGVLGRNAK